MNSKYEDTRLAWRKPEPARGERRCRSSKTYKCNEEDCGKTYSRAEHLSRHQLNHSPRELFTCDVPLCNRSFFRADLYSRHRDRHMGEHQQGQRLRSLPLSMGDSDSAQFSQFSTQDTNLEISANSHSPLLYDADLPLLIGDGMKRTTIQQHNFPGESSFSVGIEDDQSCKKAVNAIHKATDFMNQEMQDVSMWRNAVAPPTVSSGPNFGVDAYARSPFTIPDDFIQYLFNGTQPSPPEMDIMSSFNTIHDYQEGHCDFPGESATELFSRCCVPEDSFIRTSTMSVTSPSLVLSQEKSQDIFDYVRYTLVGNKNSSNSTSVLNGDRSQDGHIMSHKRMQDHINSYWQNFHSQLPILHKPSFSPNATPNWLLVAIMILGASYKTESNSTNISASSKDFSNTLAWHLRWDIFSIMHTQSDNLMVFQSLSLLETFEKTYSSRTLHERAHIHHATAITLMRRGHFLLRQSPLILSPSYKEMAGDNKASESLMELWWKDWIRREATRRVAFAAFMTDATHASLFGHSMIMVTHELRLVLPCDDVLWSATSPEEVTKIEDTLRSNGVKPLTFLEGLQRTLNGREIHINSFGRSILLCGLLSVSWHMNQRDIQLKSLDVNSQALERGTKWRRSIIRAFDLWRGFAQSSSDNLSTWSTAGDDVLGSSFDLYHLAQFTVHVDIVECQIFAGAKRVLGRVIGDHDVQKAQMRIRNNWAPSVEARKATFYALRFLCSVFNPRNYDDQDVDIQFINNYATCQSKLPIHRWILYYAALIVWCYSFSVDGATHVKMLPGTSIHGHIKDMLAFLRRVENIKTPEDVAFHRLNGCAGMLKVLCYIFRLAKWELLHEGADLLTNCIEMIDPGT